MKADSLKIGVSCPQLVLVPAGTFFMGSKYGCGDEVPQHEVTLASFYMGQYPVTFGEYDKFCEVTARKKPKDKWGRGRQPVINVTWHDAVAYCAWLSEQTGQKYTLPSEAHWEYGCRAGSLTDYCFGDDESLLDEYAWYGYERSDKQAHPVGEKKPNAFGLYDMHGNVWEWVQDKYYDSYQGAPKDGSAWQEYDSYYRVYRGGSWNSSAQYCRSALRSRYYPADQGDYLGFRVARLG